MFGKSHEYVAWESGLMPTGTGFEKFYGNVIGESDQFSPVIHDNTTLSGHWSNGPLDQGTEDPESRQAVLRLLRRAGHA